MRAVTLKNRIIAIVVIFTIILIAIFVSVQLSHELNLINQSKNYQASVSSYLFQIVWQNISKYSLQENDIVSLLQEKIKTMKQAEFVQNVYIFNTSGEVVASTESSGLGYQNKTKNLAIVDKIKKGEIVDQKKIIDEKNKSFSVYLPLKKEGQLKFVARLYFSLADIWQAFARVYQPALALGISLVIISIAMAAFLSRLIVNPIKIFNQAARKIASGRLDLRVRINTGDELEQMSESFNYMTQRLNTMKQRAENANPLTKLPGNIVIMEEVEKRIKLNQKFVVVYCDLDNFKAFNDKYGVHAGDQVIKLTGQIFKEAIREKGDKSDFIGHEGGDDFLLVTTPDKSSDIARHIIMNFDKRIHRFYNGEDLKRGYIVAHARDGSIKKFPIMTISLAGITNQHRQINSYGEVTNIAAGIKKKSKSIEKSCYVLDKRRI
ncbi:MAG: diguanylate cyclase [Candidatus Omnitrophica bacterium]|nr:diguanylate cyclase [Candidatus Omnitrophota bacterium]